MYRIHSLNLQYFKGFKQKQFALEGNNVLLYGTNGSGKSSLYWALYTLLQASIKPHGATDAQNRYLVPYASANPATHQSLRNAYAPSQASTGPDAATETALEIECRDTATAGAPPIHFRISQTGTIGYSGSDLALLQQATLASDFIYYRQLQDFSLSSNKRAVNLWPVFLRDLFPYDTAPGASGSDTFASRLRELVASFPRSTNGTPIGSNRTDYKRWEARAKRFNEDVGQYLSGLQQEANTLLQTAFSDGSSRLEITFLWNAAQPGQEPFEARQLSAETMKRYQYDTAKSPDENTEEHFAGLRADHPEQLLLSFRVAMLDEAGATMASSSRPQTFLNEARLTRVALAVRLGALLARLQHVSLRILCLDDLLVSLDSSNRWLVLRWLFDPSRQLGQQYQILFFTHDRELYRLMRHQIEVNRQMPYWCYYELFANDDHAKEPAVLPTINDYQDNARKHFNADPPDFPSCANYLRKEVERLLKRFLTPLDVIQENRENGKIIERPLEGFIQALSRHFRNAGEPLGVLDKLKLYKDLHLNPLSHDNPGTAVYQRELREIMDEIIPALEGLKQEVKIPMRETSETLAFLKQADNTGAEQTYIIEMLEPLRVMRFPSGRVTHNNPEVRWKGKLKADNTLEEPVKEARDKQTLNKVYKIICSKSGGKLTERTDVEALMTTF